MQKCNNCGFQIRKTIVCGNNKCGMNNGGNYKKEDLYISKYGPISNVNLERLLKNVKSFRGVYSSDNLPKNIFEHESGIVNLDKLYNPGTHWVAYYNHPNNKYVYYFDSYGLPPSESIKKYLKTSNKQILYNTGEIQKFNSGMCGTYCVHFIKELEKGREFYDILYDPFEPYPTDDNENDIIKIANKYGVYDY